MAKNKITRTETQKRVGYILIGFFTYMAVVPIREWVNTTLGWNGATGIIIGVVGIILSLYYFEF